MKITIIIMIKINEIILSFIPIELHNSHNDNFYQEKNSNPMFLLPSKKNKSLKHKRKKKKKKKQFQQQVLYDVQFRLHQLSHFFSFFLSSLNRLFYESLVADPFRPTWTRACHVFWLFGPSSLSLSPSLFFSFFKARYLEITEEMN